MKAEIKFTGYNSIGRRVHRIDLTYDETLDLVHNVTGKISFLDRLVIALNDLSWKSENQELLDSGFELDVPIIEFQQAIDEMKRRKSSYFLSDSMKVSHKFSDYIRSTDLEGLEQEFEKSILMHLLLWNVDFIHHILFTIPEKKRDRIPELHSYYLDNLREKSDFKNYESIGSDLTELELLLKIREELERIRKYASKQEEFSPTDFRGNKPVKSFLSKLSGQYQKELDDYWRLNTEHHLKQKRFEKEAKRINEYKSTIMSFANEERLSMLDEQIERVKAELVPVNFEEVSLESKLRSVLDANIINVYCDFKYDFFVKNDVALLEVWLPSFELYSDIIGAESSKAGQKRQQEKYRELCISVIFGLVDLIFKNDINDELNQIFFNGIVEHIDRSTGQEKESCILTIAILKSEFNKVNLKNIDLNLAFRRFNGLSARNISENIPVKPIMTINREDKRFIENRDVIGSVDNRTNLASMAWEDFEHFVRDLFEKEFVTSGGEVKITQSSRDGGIDAIAFDPDPLRGGKIVIQSKRYTNVVGVSAVRDLYGTVLNEGANKGILVTTSHFGSDAYDFAKNKPLSLIDGDNLLILLTKHNVNAKIDIKEARENLNSDKNN